MLATSGFSAYIQRKTHGTKNVPWLPYRKGQDPLRLIIDKLTCDGYGKCARIAPDLFRLAENGIASAVVDGDLDPAQLTRAKIAAQLCPVKAIGLAETAPGGQGSE